MRKFAQNSIEQEKFKKLNEAITSSSDFGAILINAGLSPQLKPYDLYRMAEDIEVVNNLPDPVVITKGAGNGIKIFVDDEKFILDLLKEAFSDKGYSLFFASQGEDAINIIKKEKVQIVFVDMNLPDMTGIDLCWKIKKINPMAILFAMTGYGSLFQLADCREAGFDDYFLKPIDIKLFLKAVEDAFDKFERWTVR